jgi:hypothetical protein
MAWHYRRPSGPLASKGSPNPKDVHVSEPEPRHTATVPDVDELTRRLDEVLDSTSYTIHSGSEFRGSPAQRAAGQHEHRHYKNIRQRDRELSWALIAYLLSIAGLLFAAAYRLLS